MYQPVNVNDPVLGRAWRLTTAPPALIHETMNDRSAIDAINEALGQVGLVLHFYVVHTLDDGVIVQADVAALCA